MQTSTAGYGNSRTIDKSVEWTSVISLNVDSRLQSSRGTSSWRLAAPISNCCLAREFDFYGIPPWRSEGQLDSNCRRSSAMSILAACTYAYWHLLIGRRMCKSSARDQLAGQVPRRARRIP